MEGFISEPFQITTEHNRVKRIPIKEIVFYVRPSILTTYMKYLNIKIHCASSTICLVVMLTLLFRLSSSLACTDPVMVYELSDVGQIIQFQVRLVSHNTHHCFFLSVFGIFIANVLQKENLRSSWDLVLLIGGEDYRTSIKKIRIHYFHASFSLKQRGWCF